MQNLCDSLSHLIFKIVGGFSAALCMHTGVCCREERIWLPGGVQSGAEWYFIVSPALINTHHMYHVNSWCHPLLTNFLGCPKPSWQMSYSPHFCPFPARTSDSCPFRTGNQIFRGDGIDPRTPNQSLETRVWVFNIGKDDRRSWLLTDRFAADETNRIV